MCQPLNIQARTLTSPQPKSTLASAANQIDKCARAQHYTPLTLQSHKPSVNSCSLPQLARLEQSCLPSFKRPHLTQIRTFLAIMGYSKDDTLAINTIRLLAVNMPSYELWLTELVAAPIPRASFDQWLIMSLLAGRCYLCGELRASRCTYGPGTSCSCFI